MRASTLAFLLGGALTLLTIARLLGFTLSATIARAFESHHLYWSIGTAAALALCGLALLAMERYSGEG